MARGVSGTLAAPGICSVGARIQLHHVATAARAGGHAHAGLTEKGLVVDLAFETRLGLGRAGQGFPVHDLRPAHGGFHAVLAAQAIRHDVEVKLAHAADDGLSGLGILAEAEGRIFVGQLGQAEVEPFLFGLGLGLDGAGDDRLVRLDAAKQDGRLGRVHGVAGAGLLEPHGDHDAAGAGALDALAAVGVHGEEPGDFFVAPGARVLDLVAGRSTPE